MEQLFFFSWVISGYENAKYSKLIILLVLRLKCVRMVKISVPWKALAAGNLNRFIPKT